MRYKTLFTIVLFALQISLAAGSPTYEIISYTSQAKVTRSSDGHILSTNGWYYTAGFGGWPGVDFYVEQEAGAEVRKYDTMYGWSGSCLTWGFWIESFWSMSEGDQDFINYPDEPESTILDPLEIEASLSFIFQPHADKIDIISSASAGTGYRLTNITTGQDIWSPQGIYSINPDHTYEMYMYSNTTIEGPYYWGTFSVFDSSDMHVDFTIYSTYSDIPDIIPAPGAILLAGIGTSIVGWMRRRRAL